MKKLKQKKHISGGKFIIKRIIWWTGMAVAAAIILSTGTVTVYRFINPVVTPLMVSRWRDGTVMKTERKWTDYEQISQNMVDAVVASEDNLFAEHSGFDFKEMRIAYEQYQNGRTLRGASTITQQTCKNVFLWDGRSYVRKGLEAWFTVLVEMLWSKRRIMEVYLNVIETGTGIYGIEAAAQIYYKKPASRLSREESAMIAAILPSPAKRNPVKPSAYLIKRQHQILDLMDKTGTVKL